MTTVLEGGERQTLEEKKKIRKSMVGASIFAALPTTDIVEGKNMCLIELRA